MPASTASRQLPALRWDIFCRVIDNHGDLGVCWRLAADLAGRGHAVRLWCDDAGALAWMAPGGAPGVTVLPWPRGAVAGGPGDVVVEAFGCEIAPEFIAGGPGGTPAAGRFDPQSSRAPVWINLEYLSAEPWAARCHGLPSPVLAGPAAGRTKWFFYPGFTPATGGLLREPGLLQRMRDFDAALRAPCRAAAGAGPRTLVVQLFCYEPPALATLLAQLRGAPSPVLLQPAAGRPTAWLRAVLAGDAGPPDAGLPLAIDWQPAVAQPAFDQRLWAADVNFVRGEDSLVRALWAGRPFVWQLYPQADGAHEAKLEAFLDWLDAPRGLRDFHRVWNGTLAAPLPPLAPAAWADCARAARKRLAAQEDLATQLVAFARAKGAGAADRPAR